MTNTEKLAENHHRNMKSDLLSLVLLDDRVRKITHPFPICTRKYERTKGFLGLQGYDNTVVFPV